MVDSRRMPFRNSRWVPALYEMSVRMASAPEFGSAEWLRVPAPVASSVRSNGAPASTSVPRAASAASSASFTSGLDDSVVCTTSASSSAGPTGDGGDWASPRDSATATKTTARATWGRGGGKDARRLPAGIGIAAAAGHGLEVAVTKFSVRSPEVRQDDQRVDVGRFLDELHPEAN